MASAQPALPFENRLGPSHHNAPETSGQAAVANFPRSGSQRAEVLLAIYFGGYIIPPPGVDPFSLSGGLTDQEIANRTGLVGDSVRPRRGELVKLGLLEDSGYKRSSNMGNPAVIWSLTEEGLRVAKELADA